MPPTKPPSRRLARRIFIILLLFGAAGFGLWWKFLRPERDPALGGENRELPVAPELLKFEEERPLMGTVFRVVAYGADEQATRKAISDAFSRASSIEDACSDYNPSSEISILTEGPTGRPQEVSPTLAAVLAHARGVAEVTNGAFDPTLGILTSLWRQSRDSGTLPDGVALEDARAAAGWEGFTIDPAKRRVIITTPGLRFDLGGIAKGFAADEMLATLRQAGINRALIAAGGDIRLGDPPPDAQAWRVGLRTLGPEMSEFIRVANCAVSTSGDLHQFIEIDGRRYSHILDPTTGLGLTRRIAATVVAPTAVQSDPFATFCCIQPDAALAAFAAGDIACRIVVADRGGIDDRPSQNFPPIDRF